MNRRLGVFGGTFDPPHLGHLILAAEAQAQLGLEKVLFVLTPQPPHKLDNQISALEERLDLLAAAVRGQAIFELSRVEIDRPGPHYTTDTLTLLGEQFPDCELVYLMGGDSLDDLPGWYKAPDLLAACAAIGVMLRPGAQPDLAALEAALPGLSAKLQIVDAPLLQISSSQIRVRVRDGGHFRFYLPGAVYELILQRGLYK
ncbi:MAG: nicotinate-nucleotide adenylyltransferase [Anaerolineales bacterium]|nr:nicotinate-nucleotide adenylyltransferase [Anaerolineales bacterium]